MILAALALAAATPVAARIDAVATAAGLAGEVLVAKGDTVLIHRGYGAVRPNGGTTHKAGERWRLASITKQIVATLIVRSVGASGGLDVGMGEVLDIPNLHTITLRQLLTHHSGLPNPDETPAGAGGVPSFYLKPAPDISYCTARPAVAGGAFRYNNCDYLIAGLALVGDLDGPLDIWPRGMTMAQPGEVGVAGYVGGKAEPALNLSSFYFAGGLLSTARAVFGFDRALMTGKLLPLALRDGELWRPEGNGSAQALGQWVFAGQLKGCVAPTRIVQRDGEIGGVQARNFILPDDDLVVIVFTNRSSDDFKLGEVWEGRGFVYDLLSAAACPRTPKAS